MSDQTRSRKGCINKRMKAHRIGGKSGVENNTKRKPTHNTVTKHTKNAKCEKCGERQEKKEAKAKEQEREKLTNNYIQLIQGIYNILRQSNEEKNKKKG